MNAFSIPLRPSVAMKIQPARVLLALDPPRKSDGFYVESGKKAE